MMKKVISILLTLGVVALVFLSYEIAAQVEPNFQIISTKLVDKVKGVNATSQVIDLKNGSLLILTLKVAFDADMVFHTTDFKIKYKYHGKESSSRCVGLSLTSTSSLNKEEPWFVGTYMKLKLKKGVYHIKLAFESVEAEVKTVNLDYSSMPVIKNISIR